MLPSLVLFALSFSALIVTTVLKDFQDLQMLAASMLAASLYLLLQEWWRGRKAGRLRQDVIIDGSNVMHWLDERPQLQPLLDVIAYLKGKGFRVGVVFDANAGWKLWDQYRGDHYFAQRLGLADQQVLVVAKGQPADPVILAAARENGAQIITNDRYRDWVEQYPEIAAPGHLVRGGYRKGQLWLDERAMAPRSIAAN
ncbi:NYN domain-containing protein [Thioclava sp. FR2]|uniref:NYN domain-containing protein n=1 Tax=Thioclava sp. FR2 TaxID=3445780 RepID=UPI003EBA79AA